MSKNITISDVARHAGTNVATVSYALNGRRELVSERLNQRVLAAAKELGYRPSRQARRLRGRSNMALAMQLDSSAIYGQTWTPTFPLAMIVQQGVSTYAAERGYRVHLLISQKGEDAAMLESQVLDENTVDGVIFMGYHREPDQKMMQLLGRLKRANIGTVTISEPLAAAGVPVVALNLRPAVQEAVERLVALSCRRVAYVGPCHRGDHERIGRKELFEQALSGADIQLSGAWHACDDGVAYGHTLDLTERGSLPDCIIYGADHLAMTGLQALARRGLRVPRDVRVMGIDHAPYTTEALVELASIDQRFFDRGQALAKVLLDQIQQPKQSVPKRTELDAYFIDGASLGDSPDSMSPSTFLVRSFPCDDKPILSK